jgi:hypothetical protein
MDSLAALVMQCSAQLGTNFAGGCTYRWPSKGRGLRVLFEVTSHTTPSPPNAHAMAAFRIQAVRHCTVRFGVEARSTASTG